MQIMATFSKKNVFLLNATIGLLMLLFVSLRLHNEGVFHKYFMKDTRNNVRSVNLKKNVPTMATLLKVPWRYHIEEDGFVFPRKNNKEKFITYERLNGSWSKQILQFENAVIFASLLQRTLLVPPLHRHHFKNLSNEHKKKSKISDIEYSEEYSMSEIIDFDLLSSMIKLGEINIKHMENIKQMKTYDVCLDPRLGFWLDYMPSVENIQMWRLLKEQHFSPLKLQIVENEEEHHACAGTEHYIDRWGPPLSIKAIYRGILTELYERPEDLILLQKDTLDTQHIRFFSKQRTKKAQELLLFYIRFSKKLTRLTKQFARMLGHGYTAILANRLHGKEDGLAEFITNQVLQQYKNGSAQTVFVICNKEKQHLFDGLRQHGFNVVFAQLFLETQLVLNSINDTSDTKVNKADGPSDMVHLLSLLLCAYATNFIGLPGTKDLYFVEHLRLQDTEMLDGLVTDKVSVRWASHTMRDKADERKVLRRKPKQTSTKNNNTAFHTTHTNRINSTTSRMKFTTVEPKAFLKPKKKLDRLHSIACIFCNYVRYVTGQHGCPSMKHIC